ncbi:MAG: hypothetical protein WC196_07190 [Bacilli bacterium]
MELYQLRRAIRNYGKFTSYDDTQGTPQKWGDLIDSVACHLYQELQLKHSTIITLPYNEPVPTRVIFNSKITKDVIPTTIHYGQESTKYVKIIFSTCFNFFFIWKCGGIKNLICF